MARNFNREFDSCPHRMNPSCRLGTIKFQKAMTPRNGFTECSLSGATHDLRR